MLVPLDHKIFLSIDFDDLSVVWIEEFYSNAHALPSLCAVGRAASDEREARAYSASCQARRNGAADERDTRSHMIPFLVFTKLSFSSFFSFGVLFSCFCLRDYFHYRSYRVLHKATCIFFSFHTCIPIGIFMISVPYCCGFLSNFNYERSFCILFYSIHFRIKASNRKKVFTICFIPKRVYYLGAKIDF